jgi:hypothetical protein
MRNVAMRQIEVGTITGGWEHSGMIEMQSEVDGVCSLGRLPEVELVDFL